MDKSVIVSVRLPDPELRKLQLLAQIYAQSVGELIRVAVSKHVEELTRTEEFKTRALELQKRNEQTLNELLDVPDESKVVRSLPHIVSKRPATDTTAAEIGRLVRFDVGKPPAGYTQMGAAASHKASKTSSWRSFNIVWKQGDDEWLVEGKDNEVVLASDTGMQPEFLTWKNIRTQAHDRFELRTATDGRTIVDIPFAKAMLRAEALRDTADHDERSALLPVVHCNGSPS